MNCKKNVKSRSDDEHRLFDPAVEKVVELGLERLRPFENHPFKVKEDEAMARLMESIERYGIMNPLIVMPTKGLVGLLLGAMLVCTIIWYRMQYMNYIILGIAEFMLVGVLAAGVFVLALVSEVRDCVGRFIIGG